MEGVASGLKSDEGRRNPEEEGRTTLFENLFFFNSSSDEPVA
jgi:hypothetical protein